MVMRARDPRQPQVSHGVAVWLRLVFGVPLVLCLFWLVRIVFEFVRLVWS